MAKEVHQHVKKAKPEGMPQVGLTFPRCPRGMVGGQAALELVSVQVYSEALQCLYERTKGGQGGDVELQELCKKIASFHTSLVANAGEALAKIVEGGIAFAFRVGPPDEHKSSCCGVLLAPSD